MTAVPSSLPLSLRATCTLSLGVALLVCAVIFSYTRAIAFPKAQDKSFRTLLTAAEEQAPDVLTLIQQHLSHFPDDHAAIFLAGEVAARMFQHDMAIQYYKDLPCDSGQWELLAQLGLAKRYRVLGMMLQEEQSLRHVLSLDPTHSDANHRLGHLLQVQGRTWESAGCFMMQLRRGKCRGDELLGVATTERFFRADEDIDHSASSANKPEAIASLGDARRFLFENRNSEAEAILRSVIAESPQIGEAQGRLGRLIFERGSMAEFLAWRGVLPEAARQHPEVWFVQGLQARRLGQTEGAIFCFLRAIELSPNHLPANVQIGGCLELAGEDEAAQFFTQRASLLSELETILNLLRDQVDETLILKAVERLTKLHRYWEAAGWLHVLAQLGLPDDSMRPKASEWSGLARRDPQQNAGFSVTLKSLGLEKFHEPNWGTAADESFSPSAAPANDIEEAVVLALDDEAAAAGIQVQYYEGTKAENRLEHIFNVVGGGIAAVDFDNDGWPDLHIAQASDWKTPQGDPVWIDSLYRNIRGQHFVDIAVAANLVEPGFSHGLCAEDFDQDGFTDIMVCNLKANRLFRNNGDGSFLDVTEAAGIAGNEWSIGGIIADFNGDGLPDVYVGNYSELHETTAKICYRSAGQQMACTPDVLKAEPDRLYLNKGDGSFADITEASGIRETSGRALGMIGWDFTGNGRTSLFVANDTSANFLFHNLQTDPSGIPQFQEEGILRGVAFDGDGNAQASMGVAAGDANNDGQIDLFVTNFANESNTFYSQSRDGFFNDVTRQVKLRDSSYTMLGFGTQFADIDGDGWEDLLAANGHVDQSADSPDADRMKPQVFRNLKGESFTEIPAEKCGSYFAQTYLGRAVATLDWNRDGRLDFGVSHIHSPFSLVTNRTEWTGRSFVVKLTGRQGTRAATGARIRVRIGGVDFFRFAIAGDGYLVTNDPRYFFAVPAGQEIEQVEIHWPGGLVQSWESVSTLAESEVMFVEGRPQAYVLESLRRN
jgi:tetratricopeptide (TPR) repeat protein